MNFQSCLITFGFLCLVFSSMGQIYNGDLIFLSQEDVDNYSGGYDEIDGNLDIGGGFPNDLSDITPLLGIKK